MKVKAMQLMKVTKNAMTSCWQRPRMTHRSSEKLDLQHCDAFTLSPSNGAVCTCNMCIRIVTTFRSFYLMARVAKNCHLVIRIENELHEFIICLQGLLSSSANFTQL